MQAYAVLEEGRVEILEEALVKLGLGLLEVNLCAQHQSTQTTTRTHAWVGNKLTNQTKQKQYLVSEVNGCALL